MTLQPGYKTNFETLLRAALAGDLALLDCRLVASGGEVAVVCAANRSPDGSVEFVPLATLFPDNPYESIVPPGSDYRVTQHRRNSTMADRMAGEIFIGGDVSRNLLPDFFKALAAQFVALEWGDAQFCPETAEELLDNCTNRDGIVVLRLCDDEARYGAFESLEAFLREHDIPFDRYSDGRYEYDPLWACFRSGQGLCEFTTNTNRKRLFSESLLVKIAAQLEKSLGRFAAQQTTRGIATVRAVQRRLRAAMATNYGPLPPFQLVGEVVVDTTDNSPNPPP